MNVSSPTASDEPQLPIEPSSTTLYPWPPTFLDPKILQIFYPTIHPSKLRFPHSPAAFEFGIHDSSGYFIIVHSLCWPCSRQPCCFNHSDNIRWPVKLVHLLIYLILHPPFHFTEPYVLCKSLLPKVQSRTSSTDCVNVHVLLPYVRTGLYKGLVYPDLRLTSKQSWYKVPL